MLARIRSASTALAAVTLADTVLSKVDLRALSSRIDVRMTGFIYSLAYQF